MMDYLALFLLTAKASINAATINSGATTNGGNSGIEGEGLRVELEEGEAEEA